AAVFDIETTGLDRFAEDAQVNTLVIGTHNTQWVIPLKLRKSPWKKYSKQLQILQWVQEALDECPETIAQNGKFDNLYMQVHYGLKFKLTFDTMLAKSLLDENTPSGLKWNVVNLLKRPDYDIDMDTKQGKGNLKKHKKYASYDGLYEFLLWWRYKNDLEEDLVLNRVFREMVMPVARAYEEIEAVGVYMDMPKYEKAKEEIQDRIVELEAELIEYADINWGSTKQIGNYLYNDLGIKPVGYTPKGAPSTAEACLKRHLTNDDHPCITSLMELRGHKQNNSFYINGWADRTVNECWLYPKYKINGAVTGRPSCEDPNLQQTPRLPLIRSIVGAPEGWTAFEADYSQIELRVMAEMSGEREMMRIFNSGGDIHEETYKSFAGISIDEAVAHIKDPDKRKAQKKEERKKAKAINFGFIYGMGWSTFVKYAFNKYDMVITPRESKNFRKSFFEKYPDLLDYHDKQRRIVRSQGYVRTLSGRIRHLPNVWSPIEWEQAEAERQAINSPVQGLGAEMTLMALPELVILEPDNIVVCGTIHDASLGRVRNGYEELLHEVRAIMENSKIMRKLGIKLTVPILVDIELGNWSIGDEFPRR
ncbi:MAG TPA: hypothetical protein ENH82_02550, partial [bacterium]|nr:hypothetical protein [bacterium]